LRVCFRSEEEDELRTWYEELDSCGNCSSGFDNVRGRGLVGSGDSKLRASCGLPDERASCSNLERRLLTAGGASDSMQGGELDRMGTTASGEGLGLQQSVVEIRPGGASRSRLGTPHVW